MRMLFLIICLLLFTHCLKLPEYAASLSGLLQDYCVAAVPAHRFFELTSAVVCGLTPNSSTETASFKNLGLYHLLVVSGSHLIFLENLLNLALRGRLRFFVGPILLVFTFFTGLQPPCLRAFVQWSLQLASQRKRLFLRSWQICGISGCLSLLLFPHWLHSYSFLLSWCCSLALSVAPMVVRRPYAPVAFYVFMLPALLRLAPPHPLSIVVNILLAPIFGFVLLPVGLLTLILPAMAVHTDRIWLAVIMTSRFFEKAFVNLQPYDVPLYMLWFYLITIQIFTHCFQVWRKRYVALDIVARPRK